MGLRDVDAKAIRFVECPADQVVATIPGTTPFDEDRARVYAWQLETEQETVEDEKGDHRVRTVSARESENYLGPELRKTIIDRARCDRYHVSEHPSASHESESADSLGDADTGRGFSNDWGISRVRSELNAQHNSMGTWQTRSALACLCPRKPYSLSDDLESFIHVFNLAILRFHKTDVTDLHTFVRSRYEAYRQINGMKIGGVQKLTDFMGWTAPFRVIGNRGLQEVLDKLARAGYESYATIDIEEVRARYGVELHHQPAATTASDAPSSPWERDTLVINLPPLANPETKQTKGPSHDDAAKRQGNTVMKGPFSSHVPILDIFAQYAKTHDFMDKAEDQFRARPECEAVIRPHPLALNRRPKGAPCLSRPLQPNGGTTTASRALSSSTPNIVTTTVTTSMPPQISTIAARTSRWEASASSSSRKRRRSDEA